MCRGMASILQRPRILCTLPNQDLIQLFQAIPKSILVLVVVFAGFISMTTRSEKQSASVSSLARLWRRCGRDLGQACDPDTSRGTGTGLA